MPAEILDLLEYLSSLTVSGGDSPEQKVAAFDAIRDLVCQVAGKGASENCLSGGSDEARL